ncbi:MAG: hypothetical protein GTN80_11820 [Nitrososphaeria archaeon]|nr:hypothetical protein [Nitrososphaeria archaeon]NIQ34304.1 hypothetical protein [Nitrososphaeria archaeon]
MRKVDKSRLRGLDAFEGGREHKKQLQNALSQRVKILRLIEENEVEAIAEFVGGEVVDCKIDDATEWVIAFRPLPILEIYYFLQRYSPEFEDSVVTFYSREALDLEISAEDVTQFTILYANALIYSAKKRKGDLPKLSRYL